MAIAPTPQLQRNRHFGFYQLTKQTNRIVKPFASLWRTHHEKTHIDLFYLFIFMLVLYSCHRFNGCDRS